MFTKAAAQRILSAQRIAKVTELSHVIVVVFQMPGVAGYCCTFVSKKAFARDAIAQRTERAASVSVLASDERYAYVLGSKGDRYVVDTLEQTCSCPDHTYRKVTCKHLIQAMQSIAGQLEGALAA
jgi:SWIM zinc finger